jgi:hypothetical protein
VYHFSLQCTTFHCIVYHFSLHSVPLINMHPLSLSSSCLSLVYLICRARRIWASCSGKKCCLGLARTVYIHCMWGHIWLISCRNYRTCTVYIYIYIYIYIWFWSTLCICTDYSCLIAVVSDSCVCTLFIHSDACQNKVSTTPSVFH